MIGKNIIKKEEIPGVVVKETLEEFSQDYELNYEQNVTLNHLARFPRFSVEDTEKIIEELESKIGLRHKVAVHIVDLIPQDLSDLRLIFAKEPTQITKEEMEEILEILNQYFVSE
ncbi:MAG: DNA-directed RNA polymerase subunit F [Methanobrevibacter sp.]|uniref:RNA polymerase Rpb4 family protein n=1 Tax=Methanobrevibacter sp. TaxID=66852 RepID=UPI0025F11DF0|nr:RNA polymerase Rpb4 family protein [Methanobrevibacter sp.]MBR0270901.1 DNA-directed RNA polymerase subunit F [Methanobrevibacter sp.]